MRSREILFLVFALGAATFAEAQSFATPCQPTAGQVRCILENLRQKDANAVSWPALVVAPPVTAGPYQLQIEAKIFNQANAVVQRIDVPDGMQLVIDSVSATGTLPSNQTPRISLSTTVRKSPAAYFIPMARQDSSDGVDFYLGTESIHVYADSPGPLILITRKQSVGDAEFSISISGTLIAVAPQ